MSSQQIKAKLLAVGLFATSVGGTFAIFGCVPMLAHLISPTPQVAPTQFQAFPEVTERPAASEPADIASPSYRNKHARALMFFNGRQPNGRQTQHAPQPRSAL